MTEETTKGCILLLQLIGQVVDALRLLLDLLSGLSVGCFVHSPQNDVLQVGVHAALVDLDHLQPGTEPRCQLTETAAVALPR